MTTGPTLIVDAAQHLARYDTVIDIADRMKELRQKGRL